MPRPRTKEPTTEIGKLRMEWVMKRHDTLDEFFRLGKLTRTAGRRWLGLEGPVERIDMATIRKLRAVSVPDHLLIEP